MDRLPFSKLQGTGNDFVIVDNRENIFEAFCKGIPEREAVKRICSRRTGVGADGLILIETSNIANFRWRFFNSDGSVAEMCGNGARCAARFAKEKGIAPDKMKFETLAGIIEAEVKGRSVKVKLSKPKDLKQNIKVCGLTGHFINTGVPHFVVFADRVDLVNVKELGRKIRNDELFKPNGTNVNFAEVRLDRILVRTYERGVEDETLACGTGSVASALIAAKVFNLSSPVTVETRSGERLKVYFDEDFEEVFLEGETVYVYEGELRRELLDG
ncbi:diaminopimelate epimerase [Phorcysia thermohydrogeniphila]|uniref:Diaminopimelate epimerase n=1 Tax=Phorcysia thermohydrogeniphila TaxID=936138 RepID=A0A4R1GEN7_9BACT|nr:diaminopimelate epimerase [Phorcysia thermohydrogeniphila]TCK06694.1 diaminopimelate epimerase [Phorcysia thermohydrogeniphila]